jgi:hypothetical protein
MKDWLLDGVDIAILVVLVTWIILDRCQIYFHTTPPEPGKERTP